MVSNGLNLRHYTAGLAHLHSCNPPVMHRDIKPSNCILRMHAHGEILACITDFGLSRRDAVDLTRTGTLQGTLRYMAPELYMVRGAGGGAGASTSTLA